MPPFIPYKRRLSASPPSSPPTTRTETKQRPTLFDTVDTRGALTTLKDNQAFLDQMNHSESESALSNLSSDEFEDVLTSPRSKKRKISHPADEDDDEVDWEDAIHPGEASPATLGPEPTGDLQLTLNHGSRTDFSNPLGKKKGPSKIERQIRIATHCMHVQFLLFHNLIRNGWLCDKVIQDTLIGQLPANVKKEVDRWRIASGISPVTSVAPTSARHKRKGKRTAQNERNQRDWGKAAEREEKGAPDMSRGDPLIRLLKVLAAYWKKRWTITAPGLRKQGYKSLATLEGEIDSYKNDQHDAEAHGERVRDVLEFRDLARKCEGSRDAGAQLFTALIRGLGIEARLVTSLQPIGFGWAKSEEASIKKPKASNPVETIEEGISSSDEELDSNNKPAKEKSSKPSKQSTSQNRRSKGARDAPIDLSDNDSIDGEEDFDSADDASVIDVTPSTPRKRPNMNYDRDMTFPTYWTESISPITNEIYPVDPFFIKPAVATNPEQLSLFESRGAKSDKAKQVFAYVVGYSADGTAKDVTTRYLKRHTWPGRTKGVRLPIEKVRVHDHKGKIKHYEDYDWFKTVMSGYSRPDRLRTAVDELEDTKDLKAAKPEKKESKAGEDSLQSYKSSAEFVLERHLRREEAIRPNSKIVKTFVAGKGDKAKEESVYFRKDVEACRTGESWHKEGRAVKSGETPMKMVPVRAVTLTRKREVEEAERDTGEKLKQGLYSWDQTDWIIPPPIEDGVIPKNAFGNMDCYVPTMVPKGAVHIPLRSTVRICKALGIDYAEAVTGFEFGNKRAVPVITGVVVAKENENAVIEQWEQDEEERRIKEEGKREKAALGTWRKWLMGLRIIQRVREEYGGDGEAHIREGMNPFTNQSRAKKEPQLDVGSAPNHNGEGRTESGEEQLDGSFLANDGMEGGGFFAEGYEEEEVPNRKIALTVEEEAPSISKSSPLLVNPPRSNANEESDLSSELVSDELPISKPRKSKPIDGHDGAVRPKPTPKAKSTKTEPQTQKRSPVKPGPNHKKRKASTLLDMTDRSGQENTSPKRATRTAPRRTAAKKRESAVTSRYFEHDSDQEDETSDSAGGGTSESEDDLAKKPVISEKGSRAPPKGRSLRARKKA